ncbi:hypothetical protein BS47DRAFT_350440 [Hydnum rufescens UP504]|uniref:Uncharacterized protein n=1 Tax=Hydnum rufescens UP504 TaxID=1448309 RepID=A0A9P6AJN0_9AGAM|nr:hypothetical protein BS47DRAFT_350440 [Hydnum rufescens UP504]
MSLGVWDSITMLANLHMRTRLRARLDTPSPLELIAYSIKKRLRAQNAGDHGGEERSQATRMNVTREVACNDVDINLMNRHTEVQSPVLGGT